MLSEVTEMCLRGVAETRAALQLTQQRIRVERAIAESYRYRKEGLERCGLPGDALC